MLETLAHRSAVMVTGRPKIAPHPDTGYPSTRSAVGMRGALRLIVAKRHRYAALELSTTL
jgi:hypothetical protein